MNLKILVCLPLLFVAQISIGQNNQRPHLAPPSLYNRMFDSLVCNDNTVPAFTYKDTLPAFVRDSLVYNPKQKWHFDDFKRLLDNQMHTDREKINLLKAASQNASRDEFEEIEQRPIEYWKRNKEARQIMDAYFLKLHGDTSTDARKHYRYFNFMTTNALPGSTALIDEYIKNRPALKIRYWHEADLAYPLIQAGREQQALDFLQLLVAEYTTGKLSVFSTGNRGNNTNPFDLLCFSKNRTIAAAAKKLVWSLINYEPSPVLVLLAWQLDKKSTLPILQKWFQYYTTLDLGTMDPATPAVNRAGTRLAPITVLKYKMFMESFSPMLGKTNGKQVANELIARLPYWKFYQPKWYFDPVELILKSALTDTSLTDMDRQQLIADFKKADDYKNPVIYKKAATTRRFEMTKVVAAIKQFKLGEVKLQPNLPDYWRFRWSLEEFDDNFHTALLQTGMLNRLSFATGPRNYKELFGLYFAPMLAKKGITDIAVQETITDSPSVVHHVYVCSKDAVYNKDLIDRGYGCVPAETFANMINLLLMKKHVKERFIKLDGAEVRGNKVAMYLLANPEKANLLLKKYGIANTTLTKVAGIDQGRRYH